MKTLFFILCPLLLSFTGDVPDTLPVISDQPTFQAAVLSLTEDTALVTAQSGDNVRAGDQFTFSVKKLPAIGVRAGDVVQLTYKGYILETWPAQIEVTSWQVVTQGGVEVPLTSQEPPALSLRCAGQTFPLSYASATWTYDEGNGNAVTFCACGISPLDAQATLLALPRASDGWVQLTFDTPPNSVSIRCWPSSLAGQPDAYNHQATFLTWDGNGFSLPEGKEGLIVELTATWDASVPSASHGSASYIVSFLPAG